MKKILVIILSLIICSGILTGCQNQQVTGTTPELSDFDAFFERYLALRQAIGMFAWDIDTGVAPVGSLESRSKTISVLDSELFSMITSNEMESFIKAVEKAIEDNTVDDITLGIYRVVKNDYDKFTCIPAEEFKAFSELTTIAPSKWAQAKEENDFSIFSPYLQEIIEYRRKEIKYRQDAGMIFDNPYDALLNDFEPGMTTQKLDVFFDELKATIVPLLHEIISLNKDTTALENILNREVPISVQKNISELLMNTVGYDLDRGVLRESAHPFTMGFGQNDVRITSHYVPNDVFTSFYTVIHECGHAIYEQNVAKELEGTILDGGTSMGIHESQSRFLENMVGRSFEFWEAIYDDFIIVTDGYYDGVTVEELYKAVNIVSPSLIRITADELTYSLHVMVRYEIEKMIFNDHELNVDDLPELWNKKMHEYLGIVPETYSEGILQDIHWSYGEFGYFPSYALGSAYAALMWDYMEKDFNVAEAIRALNFDTINGWLTKKVHRHGRLLNSEEILAQITDEGFDPKHYVDYLSQKYRKLYDLKIG